MSINSAPEVQEAQPIAANSTSAFSASRAFTAEQVRVLFLGFPSLILANIAIGFIFFITHWLPNPRLAHLLWLVALLSISGLRFGIYLYFRKKGHLHGARFGLGRFDEKRWLRIYRAGVMVTALNWGFGGYYFLVPNDPVQLAFTILTIGGLCAGSVTALAIDRISAFTFLFITPIPLLTGLMLSGTEGWLGLALFFIVGILFVGLTSNRTGDGLLELIRLRFESTEKTEALRESEQRWKFALEGARQAVWDWDLVNNWEFSASWRQMVGHSAQDTFEQGLGEWRRNVHTDDLPHAQEVMDLVVAGELPAYEVEYRYRHRAGHWIWVHARGIVVSRDANGKPLRMIGTREDITETKVMQEQLQQSQKMQTIGQLAGGVAHDFNNNLTAMMMSLDLLNADSTLSESARETVRELEDMTDRAAKITSQLLLFARRKPVQMSPLNLLDTFAKIGDLLHRLLGASIALTVKNESCHDGCVQAKEACNVWVHADSNLLDQAIINLAINARDAMPEGGKLTLTLNRVRVTDEYVRDNHQGHTGKFARIQITDTGQGISAADMLHLFEPFFTTKGVGKGTGLGLASVHGMAHQHGGWVTARSELGKGSCFELYLPLSYSEENAELLTAEPALPISTIADATNSDASGNQRKIQCVLLAEDEPMVRNTISRMLKHMDIKVIEASDATQAIQLWQAHRDAIDLVLTDLVMPGDKTGLDLANFVFRASPTLSVVVMSGYSSDSSQLELDAAQNTRFLSKPFDFATLQRYMMT